MDSVILRRYIVGILFTICIGCLLTSCKDKGNIPNRDYSLDYYTDTIEGHVILTSVGFSCVNGEASISVSSIELKNN